MKQSSVQRFESKCEMCNVYVQNDMPLGALFDHLSEVRSFVFQRIQEINEAEKSKPDVEVIESPQEG